jgi:hypothetical protein
MSMDFEERRDEYRRLREMGVREVDEPTSRQMLVARAMRPHLWSEHAEEHVSWVRRHRQTGHDTYFGTQILLLRRLMLMKAADMLRRLDREAAGLPDLGHFDAAEVRDRLRAEVRALPPRPSGSRIGDRAADAVFGMHALDGIAAPVASVANDGVVTLTWSEGGRTARLVLDMDQRATLATVQDGDERRHLVDHAPRWSDDGATLYGAVEWVHHGGARPSSPPDAEKGA